MKFLIRYSLQERTKSWPSILPTNKYLPFEHIADNLPLDVNGWIVQGEPSSY